MEAILYDLHDAVLTTTHMDAEGNYLLEFEGPYRMYRRLTFAAHFEPKLWFTEGQGKCSVGQVWRLPITELMDVRTDEVPKWRDSLLAKEPGDAWVIWFCANVGEDFAVVTCKKAEPPLANS